MSGANFTQADCDRARAAARAEAYTEAVLEERTRIVSILSLPETEGRFEVAKQLALTPGMSSETAREILLRVPIAAQRVQHENPFAQAMAALGNPDVCGIEGASHLDGAGNGAGTEHVAKQIAAHVKTEGGKR